MRVHPVSLNYSNRVDADALEGRKALLLEEELRQLSSAGRRQFLLAPLFFGRGRNVKAVIPGVVKSLAGGFPGISVGFLPPLVDLRDPSDTGVAGIMAKGIRNTITETGMTDHVAVVIVDHGTPDPEVNAVRSRLVSQVAAVLGQEVGTVSAASMERRAGREYAFNDPLLEHILGSPGFDDDVVVSPVFLSPGRHAGPGGDIVRICAVAQKMNPPMRIALTPLVGEFPEFPALLAKRILCGLRA
jgi:sirohydrochlorin ferrochelatase